MKRLALALCLLTPAVALGFVMSAGAVLHGVAHHREQMELSTLVVRGAFTFQGADASAAAAALKMVSASEVVSNATITYRMPGPRESTGSCRVELDARSGGQAAPAAIYVAGGPKTVGASVPGLKTFAASVCPLLTQRSSEELNAFLKARGVDVNTDTLGRLNGVVCYVVGSGRPKDLTTPSFWAEKDRLDPLRFVAKEGEAMVDVRLIDYSSPLCGEWHPRVVEIRRGEELTRFVADKVESNVKVPDSLF